MKLQKTPIALAVFALCAAVPFAAQAAPSVSFTSPQAGATFSKNSASTCAATASGANRVVFSLISSTGVVKQVSSDSSSPYTCTFNSWQYADGNWTLRAVASDASGATATATRAIRINNAGTAGGGTTPNTPPAVSFSAPANNTNVTAGATVSCTVNATDADGIQKVDWYLDGVLKSTDSTAPYNCSLGSLAAGSHVIRARATDTKGAFTDAQVSVTASTTGGGGVPGLTAQFAAPVSGGLIKGDATGAVTGAPNCAITGTNVAKAVFFMDGVQTNYDMNGANGWGCYFNTKSYTNGTHTLKADVYNAAGQKITISQPVTIDNGATGGSNTPPVVNITKPAVGAVLSADVTAANCEATATDANGSIAGVQFSLTSASGAKTNLQSDSASPYQCSFNSKNFPNGNYVLTAEATDNQGAKTSMTRSLSISNAAGGGGSAGNIDPADIKTRANADVVFSTQPNIYTDVLGSTPWMSTIPESGRHGTMLPNGETMRFGKELDPTNSARKAMTFQLTPSDPTTGGSKRVELGFPRNIEWDKVYWIGVSIYVHDWGTLATNDQSLFGFQLHSGTKLDLSPTVALYTTRDGRSMQIQTRYSTSSSPSQSNTVSTKWPDMPIPFGRWMDFVVKVKQNVQGNGFAQVYMDGNLIVNQQGNLGFHTPGYLDFMKFGYYNWTGGFASPRKVRLRSPVLIADPTGNKYSPADVRALLTGEAAASSAAASTPAPTSDAIGVAPVTTVAASADACTPATILCAAQ